MSATHRRGGGTLLELLVALSLGVLVLGAFSGVLAACLHWTRSLIERSEALEVVRTVWVVLDEELRPGLHGRDWGLDEGAVVSLRAFRGVGRICPPTPESGPWVVAFRGRRMPDPDRDSVMVLGLDGGWRVFDLERVDAGGACSDAPGDVLQRWTWSQPEAPVPVLVRLYERGEYHLVDGALRYRRGAGGRQPLTPEGLGPASGFRPIPGGVEVELDFQHPLGNRPLDAVRWPVRGMPVEVLP
jgi:hypothetical protein